MLLPSQSFWQRLLSGASILVAFQAEFLQALAELRSLEVWGWMDWKNVRCGFFFWI
jgi:hypothetical protein